MVVKPSMSPDIRVGDLPVLLCHMLVFCMFGSEVASAGVWMCESLGVLCMWCSDLEIGGVVIVP